jgi:hypothetical protein
MEPTERSSRHSRTRHGYEDIRLDRARQSTKPVEHAVTAACRVVMGPGQHFQPRSPYSSFEVALKT